MDLLLALLSFIAAEQDKQSLCINDCELLDKGIKLSAVARKKFTYRLFECFLLFVLIVSAVEIKSTPVGPCY